VATRRLGVSTRELLRHLIGIDSRELGRFLSKAISKSLSFGALPSGEGASMNLSRAAMPVELACYALLD
jgi:hypothetical protein